MSNRFDLETDGTFGMGWHDDRMEGDTPLGWRNIRAHPDSPAGGSGPGYSRSPRPIGMEAGPFDLARSGSRQDIWLIAASGRSSGGNFARSIAWGRRVSPEFKRKVIDITDRLGFEADWLMAVMAFETGGEFRATSGRKGVRGAIGLIQFTRDGASSVGRTKEELFAMDELEQLDYVEKYFRNCKRPLKSLDDVYLWVHFPAAVGKGPETVLYKQVDEPGPKDHYKNNAGFDSDHDGRITVKEVTARVRQALEEGYRLDNWG